MPDSLIRSLLKRDEGVKLSAYQDSESFWTIGIGRLIDARKGGRLTLEEAEYLLDNDLKRITAALDASTPWWQSLNEARQAVLISLAFNLGVFGLLGFHNMLAACMDADWESASAALLASRYARQLPLRSSRLAEALRTGDPAAFRLSEDHQ